MVQSTPHQRDDFTSQLANIQDKLRIAIVNTNKDKHLYKYAVVTAINSLESITSQFKEVD